MCMAYSTGYSRENLTAKAEQLRSQMERFIMNGKEFGEVKKIYQEYKQVLAQLNKLDAGRQRSSSSGLR